MKSLLLILATLLLVTPHVSHAVEPAPSPLRAGAATSNITPELGINIPGGFLPKPSTHVHDELHARCLVLDDGQTRIALVVCDLLGIHRRLSVEARRLIQTDTGIPPEQVMVSATHTHSGGDTRAWENRYSVEPPLSDYERFVARRIADGVRRAVNLLRPAQLGFGFAHAPEHVFNRRWIMREGTAPPNPFGKVEKVKMNPPAGTPDLVEPAGPTDPDVSIIALREPEGRMIAAFCAYSLHYVGGAGPGHLSADYFGMFCEALKNLQTPQDGDAPPFVALMANGTSGDVNNIDFRTKASALPAYEQMRRVAHDLAAKVHTSIQTMQWQDSAALAARYREIELDWYPVPPELLQWARDAQAATPRTGQGLHLPTVYAGYVLSLAAASGKARVPLQVLRIGDICIGTSPCETFAETGLEFKKRSPVAHSFLVELAHGYLGYLPTPRHYELGGYETWPGSNALESRASAKMMDALLSMTAEIAPKPK